MVQIFELIRENYDEFFIKAECSNGLTIETDNIDGIINHENMNYNKILFISCSASKKDVDKSFNRTERLNLKIGFSLRNFNYDSETVDLSLESTSTKDVRYISETIENYILNCRPWYNWIWKINFLNLIFTILFLVLFLISVIGLFFGDSPISQTTIIINSQTLNFLNFIFLGFLVLNFPPFSILKRARKLNEYLFPKVFFLIGDQKGEYNKIQKFRSQFLQTLFSTVLLAIFVGIFVNWISGKLF